VTTESFSRDGGVDKFMKNLDRARRKGKAAVKVGLPSGSGQYPNGTSVITVGVIHEFGAPGAGIPMRSFLRAGIAEATPELRALMRKVAKAMGDDEIAQQRALELLGVAAASAVRQRIVKGPFVANAESTVERKGSSSPLIDSGLLRQSITWEVER
jgi:hypothetical protein